VVRLRRRKWGERDGKRPKMGFGAGARGSDKWPEKPPFFGFPTADQERKKNVSTARIGGGRGTVVKPSSVIGLRGSRAPSWHRLRGWSSGRGHSSVRGRRVRPPQVGVRHGPGASISEAAWLPIERDPSVTTEAAELWSRAGSSTAVLNASAVTAPTPGTSSSGGTPGRTWSPPAWPFAVTRVGL
jgi:hypothetical protein